MGYIPNDAKWYVADLLVQINVEDDPRNVLHKNLVLIRADSPEQAYEKALALGREHRSSYQNPAGKKVRSRFRGIGSLNVVYDKLSDGAELLYVEVVGIDEPAIHGLIVRKEKLAVFRPIGPRKSPDYSSAEVVEEAERRLRRRS